MVIMHFLYPQVLMKNQTFSSISIDFYIVSFPMVLAIDTLEVPLLIPVSIIILSDNVK